MSKSFVLRIDTDNDAFSDDPQLELARILYGIADSLMRHDVPGAIRDINGNTVGSYSWDV